MGGIKMENVADIVQVIAKVLIVVVWFKAVTIGGDFSFYHWFKDGKKYKKWYDSKETYEEYIKDKQHPLY